MNKHLKVLIIALCSIALVVGSVAVTMAYLVDTTATANHTFTVGDIDIELNNANAIVRENIMMPGDKITDINRTVTVVGGSAACYLFIKLDKSANFDTFLQYTLADGWLELTRESTVVPGVYYREVNASADNQNFPVFTNFIANSTCTKAQYDSIKPGEEPSISLTAYAVQSANIDTVAEAWAEVSPAQNN